MHKGSSSLWKRLFGIVKGMYWKQEAGGSKKKMTAWNYTKSRRERGQEGTGGMCMSWLRRSEGAPSEFSYGFAAWRKTSFQASIVRLLKEITSASALSRTLTKQMPNQEPRKWVSLSWWILHPDVKCAVTKWTYQTEPRVEMLWDRLPLETCRFQPKRVLRPFSLTQSL